MNRRTVTDQIDISGQPTADDLRALPAEGVVGVINLRQSGEPDQIFDPAEEGELVRSLGLDYLHAGVGGAPITAETVRAIHDFLDTHAAGKVLVHCRSGPRAAGLTLLHLARVNGWAPDEVLLRGDAMGFNFPPGLRLLLQQYLNDES